MRALKNTIVPLLSAFSLATSSLAWSDNKVYEQGGVKLDLLAEIQGGIFGNTDSWFGNSDDFLGENTDHWSEVAAEVGFAGSFALDKSEFFAEVSGLYTRTYGYDASGLGVGYGDNSQSKLREEQAHLGWRSGTLFGSLDENALTVTAGNFDYSIGTGTLIADGGNDGGDRGGWWLGTRKAFNHSVLATFDSGPVLAEVFHLENNERIDGIEGKLNGANLEYLFDAVGLNLGLTLLAIEDRGVSNFEDFEVYSYRAAWDFKEKLRLEGEYIDQTKGNVAAEGWYTLAAYTFTDAGWSPQLSYRYAHFSGDDPATAEDERFHTIAYGYTNYGTWYQGEISGNYPLENSNLDSHMLRLQLTPNESLTLNVVYYDFSLDQQQIFGDPVSSKDWGDELNLAVDWAVNDNLYVIGTFGLLLPGDAAKEWSGGQEDWLYTMLYAGYTF